MKPPIESLNGSTKPGQLQSANKGAYYAGPGNRFWATLAKTGLTPRQLRSDEYAELLNYGIGLIDVAKTVFGADTDLSADAFDRVRLLTVMREVSPAYLAFNGKKAAAMALSRPTRLLAYGPVPDVPNLPPVVVLPSTSGAASGFWDLAPWRALADQVRAIAGVGK